LANANTTGFKKQDAEFEDLLYQTVRAPTPGAGGAAAPAGLALGSGARVIATPKHFAQGAILQTGNPLDVAIEGPGFIQVQRPTGDLAYTRTGSLKLDAQGRLTTSDGLIVEPPISVPVDATNVTIGADGSVSALQPGNSTPTVVGAISLALFPNPTGLDSLGHNLYRATASSGDAQIGQAGKDSRGTFLQGSLEGSNVDVVEEMVGMIRVQRAYEINSKVVQAADEMLRNATSMKG
jgi:flagellar basal-body rod protein FlgG